MHEPDVRDYRVKEYFKHKQKKFKKHASGSLVHVISNKCLFNTFDCWRNAYSWEFMRGTMRNCYKTSFLIDLLILIPHN